MSRGTERERERNQGGGVHMTPLVLEVRAEIPRFAPELRNSGRVRGPDEKFRVRSEFLFPADLVVQRHTGPGAFSSEQPGKPGAVP